MSLGTFDRTPPPFFRQGPSALTKLVFFSALSIFLMATDTRFGFLEALRSTLATGLLPLQRAADVPLELFSSFGNHLGGLQEALARERAAQSALARQADRAALADEMARENARLRGLLELRPSLSMKSMAAEVTHAAADPFSRKVIIDRGSAHGVRPGSAVINEVGLLGQVTRAHPLTSEVTLLTDQDAAIPVLNLRTQQRSAAFGGAGGGANSSLELRFMAGNSDVQVGDDLVTSGLDGLFPPGLPVARVVKVERRADTGFARIGLSPVVSPDSARYVLVLEPRDPAAALKGAEQAAGGAEKAVAAATAASAAIAASPAPAAASALRPR